MQTYFNANNKKSKWDTVGIEDPRLSEPIYEVKRVAGVPNLFRASRPGYPSVSVTSKAVKEALLAFKEDGITDIFLLLSDGEYFKYYGFDLLDYYKQKGFQVHRFPIPDFGVPRVAFAEQMVLEMHAALKQRKRVLVHCSAGQGRTGLVVNCLIEYRKFLWKKKLMTLPMEAGSQTNFMIQFRSHLRRNV